MIAITGASGWLGKATLQYLTSELGMVPERDIACFASTKKTISLPGGLDVNCMPLEEIRSVSNSIQGIFHLAFLTRDYSKSMKLQEYIETNRRITTEISEWIEDRKPEWIISVSSGAVFDSNSSTLAKNISENPYGVLKLEEEDKLFKAQAGHRGVTTIGRLWASSGIAMPISNKYALSDFISQGITQRNISVQANRRVWRRYMDASEFMRALHRLALEGSSIIVDSVGELVEIGELANEVALQLGVGVSRRELDDTLGEDRYFPDSEVLLDFMTRQNLSISTLQEQVANTIRGHQQQLNTKGF